MKASDNLVTQTAPAPPAVPAADAIPGLWILTACQFLYYGGLSVDLTLTAIVGLSLAPTVALATVPLTAMSVTAMAASYYAGTLSARFGHRRMLIVGGLAATVGGLVTMTAIMAHSFVWMCVGTAIVGLYKATGGYFRYLAADRAPDGQRTRALSLVLLGGVAAAAIGPWAATSASHLFSTMYAGSYLMVTVLAAAVVVLMLWLRPVPIGARPDAPQAVGAAPTSPSSQTSDAARTADDASTTAAAGGTDPADTAEAAGTAKSGKAGRQRPRSRRPARPPPCSRPRSGSGTWCGRPTSARPSSCSPAPPP